MARPGRLRLALLAGALALVASEPLTASGLAVGVVLEETPMSVARSLEPPAQFWTATTAPSRGDSAEAASQPPTRSRGTAGRQATPVDSGSFRKLGKERVLLRGTKFVVLIIFIVTTMLLVTMYCIQKKTEGANDLKSKGMEASMSTDRFLLKILQNFSSQAVEDYIFHGIQPVKQKVSIEFEDVSTTIRIKGGLPCCGEVEEKKVLLGVSGKFEAGHIAAIMGTSGAGKTTLLNVLCGKIGAMGDWDVTGRVKVNGVEMKLTELKSIMGFVPQDDIVHDIMTVRENIAFSAALRNPRGTSLKRLSRITDDVIQVLQLVSQQNLRVGNRTTGGGLSGGQRKRVNVGLELAACPTLLFLDEPTSGLDATGSLMLVKQLSKMAELGMTIIMVIHQPRYSLFTHIDDVLLLGKGGRTAYIGPTTGAKGYFQELGFSMPPNENPADWMMDVMSGQIDCENAKISREELPDRLFKEWEEHGSKLDFAQAGRMGSVATNQAKHLKHEEEELFKMHLKDAWKLVDRPTTKALEPAEFEQVLINCANLEPDQRVLQQLIERIDTAAKINKICAEHMEGHVQHKEFEQYLLAIARGGVLLAAMESITARVEEDRSESDEDDEDEDETRSYRSEGSESFDEDDTGHARRALTPKQDIRKELSRTLPGFCAQFHLILKRRSVQWWRRMAIRIMFFVVVEFAAAFLGVMDRYIFQNSAWLPTGFMNAQISVALLVSVYSLATFGSPDELPVFWRESSHGLNRLAFFLAQSLLDLLDMFIFCMGFTMLYYVVTAPDLNFRIYVIPFILVCYVASGWGYFVSCWLPFEHVPLGPFVSTLLCFVFGGILGLPNEMSTYLATPLCEIVVGILAFTRWGVPMNFFQYLKETDVGAAYMSTFERFLYNSALQDYRLGWHLPGDDDYFWTGVLSLTTVGTVLRILAFVGLCNTNREKQA